MDAGRAWASPGASPGAGPDDWADLRADALALGVAPEDLPIAAPQAAPATEVWSEHRPALEAFLAVSGQWRTESVGAHGVIWVIWLALDATAAQAGLALAGLSVTPATWAQVRIIEAGAREELNRGR